MAGTTKVITGQKLPVLLQLANGVTTQYPQAEIRDSDGNLLITLDLSHEASGMYVSDIEYTMPNEDFIKITYIVYSDSGHSTESAIYMRDADIFIKDNAQERLLGLMHENIYIDNTIYDAFGNLSSARVRIYSNAASVGSDNNIIGTYEITSSSSETGKFSSWKQVKQ